MTERGELPGGRLYMGEHNIVYGAKAGVRVIKPCSTGNFFLIGFTMKWYILQLCVNLLKYSEDPRGRT